MNKWNEKPRYWDNPRWFEKRNEELIRDKKEGMKIADICGKYSITPKRIYKIIQNYERKQNAQ